MSIYPLYLIFNKVNVYFSEINGNNYLTLVPASESREKIKNYEKLWSKIKDLIKSITKTQMNMMKNILKSNLIQITTYL